MKKAYLIFVLILVLTVEITAAQEMQNPVFYQGNPDCKDLGFAYELKFDPPNSGTVNGITLMVHEDLKYFDWSSTYGISAVIAKGGDNANIYYYNPTSMGDQNLVSPLNNGEQVPALSHATFCWNEEPSNDEADVPEFGLIGAALVIVGALGFLIFRRK